MSPSENINRLSDEFEASWQAGNQPSIERTLQRCGSRERSALLERLIVLDVKYRDRTAARPTADGYAGFGEAALRIANREIAAMKVRGAGFLPSAADPYATIVGPERPAEPHEPAARDQSHVLDRIGRADKLDENSSVMGPYKLLQQIGHGEGHSFHFNAAAQAESSLLLCLS